MSLDVNVQRGHNSTLQVISVAKRCVELARDTHWHAAKECRASNTSTDRQERSRSLPKTLTVMHAEMNKGLVNSAEYTQLGWPPLASCQFIFPFTFFLRLSRYVQSRFNSAHARFAAKHSVSCGVCT